MPFVPSSAAPNFSQKAKFSAKQFPHYPASSSFILAPFRKVILDEESWLFGRLDETGLGAAWLRVGTGCSFPLQLFSVFFFFFSLPIRFSFFLFSIPIFFQFCPFPRFSPPIYRIFASICINHKK